jgi:hypothetical protein
MIFIRHGILETLNRFFDCKIAHCVVPIFEIIFYKIFEMRNKNSEVFGIKSRFFDFCYWLVSCPGSAFFGCSLLLSTKCLINRVPSCRILIIWGFGQIWEWDTPQAWMPMSMKLKTNLTQKPFKPLYAQFNPKKLQLFLKRKKNQCQCQIFGLSSHSKSWPKYWEIHEHSFQNYCFHSNSEKFWQKLVWFCLNMSSRADILNKQVMISRIEKTIGIHNDDRK